MVYTFCVLIKKFLSNSSSQKILKENCFLYSQHFWNQMCAFSIPGNSDSTWSWRRSLRVQSHKTAPYFRCQFQVQASSTSDWLVLKGGFPQPPPWVWSFVKMAHRIQENTLLTVLLAYYEEYNLEIPKWKRCFGQGTWKGCGASMPSSGMSPSPHLDVLVNLEARWSPSFTVLLEVPLHSREWLNHWPPRWGQSLVPLPSPKVSTLSSHGWFLWQPAPSLQKSPC